MKIENESPPISTTTGNPQPATRPSPTEISNETLSLMSKLAEHKRKGLGLSQSQLARKAGVSVNAVMRLEVGQADSLRLGELKQILRVLDQRLAIVLTYVSQPLPKTNDDILAAFDLLLKKGKPNVFVRNARDNELPGVFWDVVGDCDLDRLFVVASNRRKKVRFGKVTDETGGWSIAGQRFGIDAETQLIADQLSEQLIKQHRSALTMGEPARRLTRTPKKN